MERIKLWRCCGKWKQQDCCWVMDRLDWWRKQLHRKLVLGNQAARLLSGDGSIRLMVEAASWFSVTERKNLLKWPRIWLQLCRCTKEQWTQQSCCWLVTEKELEKPNWQSCHLVETGERKEWNCVELWKLEAARLLTGETKDGLEEKRGNLFCSKCVGKR